jgi:hypothetical protein
VNISVWNLTHSDNFHYRYPVNSFDFVHAYFVPEALAAYDPHSRPNFTKREDQYPPTEFNTDPYDNGGNYTCDIYFSVINQSIMRICSEVISTCASDWTDSDVEAMCLAYTDVYCDYPYFYRNPYCAHCNRVNLSQKSSCYLMTPPQSNADFSWILKPDYPEYEMSPPENGTIFEDVDGGKITLIFTSTAHPRLVHEYLPRTRRDL